ncbi:MAG: C-GCAxxG-C-C family protein [Thermodesulfobacteriota bacterium]
MIDISRRKVLKAGSLSVIAGAGIIAGLNLPKVKDAKASTVDHPYGYPVPGLDVAETRQLAYNGYYGIRLADGITHKHCAFATFHALISQLADTMGGPYTEIPTQMMEWASGGVAGYASLCGAINGACAAIGIICKNADATAIISNLLNWASTSSLPMLLADSQLDVKISGELPQTIAGSELCHVSVTKWCLASGYASGSAERSERCARLAGDIAARAVELLNGAALTEDVPVDSTVCGQCHYSGTDYDAGQFTRGFTDCTSCHVDLNKVSEEGHFSSIIKPE